MCPSSLVCTYMGPEFGQHYVCRCLGTERHQAISMHSAEYNNKTVLLRDTVHQISRGESAADSPRDIWWTVSRNYTVLFLSRDVKNTKFNQYLPVDLTSLNVSNSRFRKPVMFWRWRHQGVALWRHGRSAWHNCLPLATASNVN